MWVVGTLTFGFWSTTVQKLIHYICTISDVYNTRNILKDKVEKDNPLSKEYLDKAAVFDVHMVDEWNKIVDVLPVYVGYFLLPSR